jgi:hypothetical protein
VSIYDPFCEWLSKKAATGVTDIFLTFAEIEVILGFELPQAAKKRPQWWSNESSTSRHVQSQAWSRAGYKTRRVNLSAKSVGFAKK